MTLLLVLLQGWAYGGSLLGSWMYGHKSSLWGPLIGVSGFLPWSLIAWDTHLYPMIGFNLFVSSIHLRNALRWNQDRT